MTIFNGFKGFNWQFIIGMWPLVSCVLVQPEMLRSPDYKHKCHALFYLYFYCILSRRLKAPLYSKLFQVEGDSTKAKNVTTADTLMDLLRNSFPPNIIQATMQQYKTEIIYPGEENVSRLFFIWIIGCHEFNPSLSWNAVILIWYWICGGWP